MPNEVDIQGMYDVLQQRHQSMLDRIEGMESMLQTLSANVEYILEHVTQPPEPDHSTKDYTHLLEYVTEKQLTYLMRDTRLLDKLNFSAIPGCWIWKGTTQYGNPVYRPSEYPGEKITGQKNTRRVLFDRFFPEVLENGNLTKFPRCDNQLCVNPFHAMRSTRFAGLLNGHDNPASLEFGINELTEYTGRAWKSPLEDSKPESPKESTEETFLQRSLRLQKEKEQEPED